MLQTLALFALFADFVSDAFRMGTLVQSHHLTGVHFSNLYNGDINFFSMEIQ